MHPVDSKTGAPRAAFVSNLLRNISQIFQFTRERGEERTTAAVNRIAARSLSTLRLSSWALFALLLQVSAGPAHAGAYDDALSRAKYVVMTADYNNDGVQDVLMKATPGMVLIPLDDLLIPIPVESPSPTFVLLSATGGTYTLVAAPDAAMLASTAWVNGTQTLTYTAATTTSAASMTITASNSNEAGFVISMTGDTGVLQLTSTTPPANTPPPSPPLAPPAAVTLPPIAYLGNADAGTLAGSATVSGGKVNYSMPLAMPPGVGGMVPSVSLKYTGGTANGIAGVGWSLSGSSSITRCGPTVAQDGRVDTVRLTERDRLCLDGQRLVLASAASGTPDSPAFDASYWSASAEYRTELESYAKVVRTANGFTVYARDGRVSAYGGTDETTRDAPGVAGAVTYTWTVRQVEDRAGNAMQYEYSKDATTGEHLLKLIRWGANANAGQAAFAKVAFSYEARPDAEMMFSAGARNDLNKRLSRITTSTDTSADGTGGVQGIEYALAYRVSASSGRSMVESVKACSATDGCLPATTFKWGEPDASVVPEFVTKGIWHGPVLEDPNSYPYGVNKRDQADMFVAGDFNGDGKTDVMDRFGGHSIKLYINTGAEFAASSPFTGRLAGYSAVAETQDFDGDGQTDLLIVKNVALNDAPSTVGASMDEAFVCYSRLREGLGFECKAWTHGAEDTTQRQVYDFNSDGRPDIYFSGGRPGTFNSGTDRLCLSIGDGFQCTAITSGKQFYFDDAELHTGTAVTSLPTTDIDGDGHADLIRMGKPWYNAEGNYFTFFNPYIAAHSYHLGNGGANDIGHVGGDLHQFDVPESERYNVSEAYRKGAKGKTGDLNGDGYSDLFMAVGVTIGSSDLSRCLSKGRLAPMHCELYTNLPSKRVLALGEFDGDGVPKVMLDDTRADATQYSHRLFEVCGLRSNNASSCRQWRARQFFGPEDANPGYQGPRLFRMNFVGDDRDDLVYYQPGGIWEMMSQNSLAKPGEELDRMVQVTNGHGLETRFEYAAGNDPSIYNPIARDRNGAEISVAYPKRRLSSMGPLAKSIKVSNGQGGWLETRFSYSGAVHQPDGRGYLGFARIDVTEVGTGIIATNWYSHDWPFVGMVTATRQSTGSVYLQDASMTPGAHILTHASGQTTRFPFVSVSTSVKNDLTGKAINAITTTTTSTYGDGWGNLTLQEETVSGGGASFESKTSTIYQSTASNWLIGLPTRVVSSKVRNGVTQSRTKTATYDGGGRLETETTEPDHPELRVVTTMTRANPFANLNKTTQTWRNPATLGTETRTVLEVLGFDAKNRFVKQVKNAAGHVEEFGSDSRTGVQTKHVTPNHAATISVPDAFGRVRSKLLPDGIEQRIDTKRCDASCPLNATHVSIATQHRSGTRFGVPTLAYLDNAGRQLRVETIGFDGKTVVSDTRYDTRGRSIESDHPRFANVTAQLASKRKYDILNRQTESTVFDTDNVARTTTMSYDGLTVATQSAKLGVAQIKTSKNDALGLLEEATDAEKGVTKYGRDAFGNLTSVTDPASNVVRITYDGLGRRTQLSDPDLGVHQYDVDPLGRVWRTQSPKQAPSGFTTIHFDAIDRMTSRQENDLSSVWVYDTATNGIGQLAEAYTGPVHAKTYRRQHVYDGLGRPGSVTTLLDTTYVSLTTYDEFGRLGTVSHQRGAAPAKTYKYVYSGLGFLQRLERAGARIWELNSVDAAQRHLSALLGNGLTHRQTFNPYSAQLATASVDTATGTSAYVGGYTYDELGNVLARYATWQDGGFSERFDYDLLNRLKFAQVTNQPEQHFTYDAIGNLKSKTGVGSGAYVYPSGAGAQRPHAVQSIAGLGNYTYDANGNLETAPDGTAVSWKSFDMPDTISRKGASSQFAYGPEHQRARQTRSDGTSLFYAGAMEVEVKQGLATVKTYWPMQLGVEIERPGQPVELLWTHRDSLGSVVGISGINGTFKEKLAYDAWGKRRTLDGASTPDTIDGQVDNRGYTGHEMLDNVDMVHMNGRIYDPFISRFLSADPLIQDPEHSQSYNRYSYVWNNPMNMTDPTGFAGEDAQTKAAINNVARDACSGSVDSSCKGRVSKWLVGALNDFLDSNGATIVAGHVVAANSLDQSPSAASANNFTSPTAGGGASAASPGKHYDHAGNYSGPRGPHAPDRYFEIGKQRFLLRGGTVEHQAEAEAATRALMDTPLGKKEMLPALEKRHASWYSSGDHVIDMKRVRNDANVKPSNRDKINIDPYYRPRIDTKLGPRYASFKRTLWHEFGHSALSIDDNNYQGQPRMENIIRVENPLMLGIGEPERIRYDYKR